MIRRRRPPAVGTTDAPRYEGELRQYNVTDAERRYTRHRSAQDLQSRRVDRYAQRITRKHALHGARRQAAAAVGLTESAYYPYIVAAAVEDTTGLHSVFQRCALSDKRRRPMATCRTWRLRRRYVDHRITAGARRADCEWLLLDFGERKATRAAAREQL